MMTIVLRKGRTGHGPLPPPATPLVVNQLKEKCRDTILHRISRIQESLRLAVQIQAVLISLQEQGIEDVYIELLKEFYTNSSTTVHLHKESNNLKDQHQEMRTSKRGAKVLPPHGAYLLRFIYI